MDTFKRTIFGSAAVLGLPLLAAGELFAAPTVTAGFDPVAALTGAVRYRNLSNTNTIGTGPKEIIIGVPPLTSDINPIATGDVSWNTTGRCVQFTYDGSGTLTTKVAATASPCSFATPLVTVTKSDLILGTLNYLQIGVTKNSPTNTVALNSVTLGADSLGSFSLDSPASGPLQYKVTNINVTAGFTLTGTVALTSLSGGGDSSFIELSVGYVPPLDAEGPVTSSVDVTPKPVLLNGEGTVTANVDDSTTGHNNIASAVYSLDGEAGNTMLAQDGAFDEESEDVTGTFTATAVGTHEVCVYGTDFLGNVGDFTCQNYLVTYKFGGFFSPIDNDLLNVAKAGQAIPAQWRLTDADGVAIADLASFVNLYSYPISCTDLQGDITDAVEEYASGASGLQYNGDGYFQFNWKTPKDYANTCRAMYVEFNSGALSPIVKFQFKK